VGRLVADAGASGSSCVDAMGSNEVLAERWLASQGLCPQLFADTARDEVAWHEAAHAAVMVALKLPMKGVKMRPANVPSEERSPRGEVITDLDALLHIRTATSQVKKQHNLDWIVVHLAGPVGQYRRYGRCTGHATDLDQAIDAARKVGAKHPSSLRQMLTHARLRADGLLARHEGGWTRLAARLVEVDSVGAFEVEQLITAPGVHSSP
jgi:hypothetical protein